MKIRVHVVPRQGVLDPQGEAVARGLAALGFDNVGEVRVGRVIDLDLADGLSAEQAQAQGEAMARKLLANGVVEDFTVRVVG